VSAMWGSLGQEMPLRADQRVPKRLWKPRSGKMKISVPLDDWELNFLIDLLGPEQDMAPRTLKLYRTLKSTHVPTIRIDRPLQTRDQTPRGRKSRPIA